MLLISMGRFSIFIPFIFTTRSINFKLAQGRERSACIDHNLDALGRCFFQQADALVADHRGRIRLFPLAVLFYRNGKLLDMLPTGQILAEHHLGKRLWFP